MDQQILKISIKGVCVRKGVTRMPSMPLETMMIAKTGQALHNGWQRHAPPGPEVFSEERNSSHLPDMRVVWRIMQRIRIHAVVANIACSFGVKRCLRMCTACMLGESARC